MVEIINQLVLQNKLVPKVYKRNEFLVKGGQKDTNIYWVKSGAARIYYPQNDEELTIRFGYTNSLIASLPSFFNGTNSLFYIQALRKTEVIVIPKALVDSLMDNKPEITKMYLLMLESLLGDQIAREMDLLTNSPQERLNKVLKRSPQLFQEIPSKYIANYLRMSPETLSRILNQNS